MKETLLVLNTLYFLFGATLYMGTMWVLRLFLYPTWRSLTPENVDVHFGIPTSGPDAMLEIVWPSGIVQNLVVTALDRHITVKEPAS